MESTSSDMQRGNTLTKLVRSKALRFYLRVLSRVLGFLLIASVVLEIVLAYGVARDVRILPSTLRQGNNFLLVTAHPDDECLFFSPTVLGVLDGNTEMKGGLLVLSAGNNYGIGETRKKELKGSCEVLGIDFERCVVLDEKDLPKLWWDEDVIMSQVKQYIKKWKVDIVSLGFGSFATKTKNYSDSIQIVTIDEGGVS
jgi:N-acetylglucosaminylphosphatidylinositol deacetylase